MAGIINIQNPPAFGAITSKTPNYGTIVNHSGISLPSAGKLAGLTNWAEVDGYRERFTTTEAESVRVFDVDWDTRKTFIDAMLGYSLNLNRKLVRQLPDQHPDYPWMYAVDCELMQGMGAVTVGPTDLIYYYNNDPANPSVGIARYKVTYRRPDYEILSDAELGSASELFRYVTYDSVRALTSLPTPMMLLRFAEGSNGPPNSRSVSASAGNKVYPTREVSWIWHEVPDIPSDAWDNCEGKVNKYDFPDSAANLNNPALQVNGAHLGLENYPAGTLLCLAPQKKRQCGVTGRICWNITYRFLYRRQGHNYFPSLESGKVKFRLATYDGTPTGETLYEYEDFNQLFTQPDPQKYHGADG